MSRFFSLILLLCFLMVSLYPFGWMFFSSFKTNKEIYQPAQLLPEKFDGQAYAMLLDGQFVDFGQGLGQSFFIAGSQSLLATVVSALVGFVLALLTLSLPFLAVVRDRSGANPVLMPAALERDGSSPPAPVSVTRLGQPAG